MISSIRYITDEHVAHAVVWGLRQRGVNVQTVSKANLNGAHHEDHLAWANQHGRVLFTQNTDFLRLHAVGIQHEGIVLAPRGTFESEVVAGLRLIPQFLKPQETAGQIEFL